MAQNCHISVYIPWDFLQLVPLIQTIMEPIKHNRVNQFSQLETTQVDIDIFNDNVNALAIKNEHDAKVIASHSFSNNIDKEHVRKGTEFVTLITN